MVNPHLPNTITLANSKNLNSRRIDRIGRPAVVMFNQSKILHVLIILIPKLGNERQKWLDWLISYIYLVLIKTNGNFMEKRTNKA